jgi:CarboxypepD_reg-like domain/TonB-dependent Receptor Plug Domain
MKSNLNKVLFTLLLLCLHQVIFSQQIIKGQVHDINNNDPLTGATITVEGTKKGTIVDVDGNFQIPNLQPGNYTLVVTYVSYKTKKVTDVVLKKDEPTTVDIKMEEASVTLNSVTVIGQKKTDTELSMLKSVRTSIQVVNGISSQQIGKTLDKDASEVVKRIPGITIQDDRFIVVRGLNQRYNNVWLNNAATPSSETDVKAFSFDAIPSNMIDNLMVFKTGTPELSAEATGAFIKIFTKNIPEEKFMNVEYGAAYNDQTTFKPTYRLPNSNPLDLIGFGAGARSLRSTFPSKLSESTLPEIANRDQAALTLSNNWIAKQYTALPNQKINFSFGNKWTLDNGCKLGSITSINYNNSYTTRTNMTNNLCEGFDATTEQPIYSYKYITNIYSVDYKLGLMHNWAYLMPNGSKIEFKNTFNQMGSDKSANTGGWNNNRGGNFLYYGNQYSSRTTYSGQLSGFHPLNEVKESKLDWNVGFAYANRLEPDRQNRSLRQVGDGSYQYMIPSVASINELGRLYLSNHEYVETGALNFEQKIKLFSIKSTFKSGLYGEYKTRELKERSICYQKNSNNPLLTDSAVNNLNFNDLFSEQNLGFNKVLNISDQTNITNSYDASNSLMAGYLALNLPLGNFNVYGGVRCEYNVFKLNGVQDVNTPIHRTITTTNFFPSINANYNITKNSLIRIAYASTINRPEFRERAPFVYYDNLEKYTIRGNELLKDARIQNLDIRFENYPSPNETFSIAAFYKRFTNPIEMVSVGSESSFSFDNAISATNYGIELEVKKSLETLIGLKNFSLGLNASYIYSKVDFGNSQSEQSRPLQGQSPYVINTALFYQNDKWGISSALMYNVIGSRILVAAQLNQGTVVEPSIVELPRNVLDYTISKKLGKKLELKFGIKDILAQDNHTQQTFEYTTPNGISKSATVTTKRYNLGRTWSLGIVFKI